MSNTPKFRFQSGKLFFLVWYICTQAIYTYNFDSTSQKCTIDVDLCVKFNLATAFIFCRESTKKAGTKNSHVKN